MAALGLGKPLEFVPPAFAETPLEPTVGFYKYKVGDIEVTAVYDGIWRKPHDPTFIKNATVEETKAALAKAGLTTEFMPIPLTVIVLKIGGKYIMVDAGSGVGQWQANATHLPANMRAAGIDRGQINTILDLAFPPRPCLGPDGEGDQRGGVPECRAGGQRHRIQLVDRAGAGREASRRPPRRRQAHRRGVPDLEELEAGRQGCRGRARRAYRRGVRPHARPFRLPRHLRQGPAHGVQRHHVRAALLAPHPEWQGTYDQDGPTAITARRALVDRVIADKIAICGAHFPFPGAGTFVKDGNAYAFTPVVQS